MYMNISRALGLALYNFSSRTVILTHIIIVLDDNDIMIILSICETKLFYVLHARAVRADSGNSDDIVVSFAVRVRCT